MKLRCHGTYGLICVLCGWTIGGLNYQYADLVALFLYGGGGALMVEHLARYKKTHD